MPVRPLPPIVGVVPAPYRGLGGYSNYILYSNCNPLINLSVTIDVTEDIFCESVSASPQLPLSGNLILGFGFQLNAYSPKNYTSAWQQYVLTLTAPNGFTGAVSNSQSNGYTSVILQQVPLARMPSPKFPTPAKVEIPQIPAGYKLEISLQNDTYKNVSGVTYVITDNLGNMVANVPLTLLLIPGATAADLAPIVAFELNLVGPINGETAVLTSGAGTITYASPSGLWVLSEEPDCVETGVGTLENANSSYGIMSFFGTGPATKYTQSFSISNTVPPPGPRQRPR